LKDESDLAAAKLRQDGVVSRVQSEAIDENFAAARLIEPGWTMNPLGNWWFSIGIAVVFTALGWFVTRTDAGLGMRAAAEDLGGARLVGLDVDRLIVVAFAIASAFAGLAGVLWAAQAGIVEPDMGFTPLLKAFVAAIIGGFGSIAGALVGGYVLGALEVFIVAFLPSVVSPYRDAIVFAFLIAFLLFRPNGLLNRAQEVKL